MSRGTFVRRLVLGAVLLAGGCGDSPAPPRGATEADLRRVLEETAEVERAIVPAVGTPRADVERRLGTGRPTAAGKAPALTAPDPALAAYDVGTVGTVLVRYDEAGRVRWAHVVDVHTSKGLPIGVQLPLAQRLHEATRHLEHARRIRRRLEETSATR
jgi:hypothetical protein